MPDRQTIRRAKEDKRKGRSASTQAGEFVREEIHHIREGKHGARSAKQAIAIGLSKARRAGVDLAPPRRGSRRVRERAADDLDRGARKDRPKPSPRRSRASTRRLKNEDRSAASHAALSRHARKAARTRSAGDRSAQAKRAAATRKKARGRRRSS